MRLFKALSEVKIPIGTVFNILGKKHKVMSIEPSPVGSFHGINFIDTGSATISNASLWGCEYEGMYDTFKDIYDVASYFIPSREDWWEKFYVINFLVWDNPIIEDDIHNIKDVKYEPNTTTNGT